MKALFTLFALVLVLLVVPGTASAQYAYGDSYLYEDASLHVEGYSITYNSYQALYISVGVDAALHDPDGNVLSSGSDVEWWNGLDAYVPLAADTGAGFYYIEGHHYYSGDGWGPVDVGTTRYYADTGEVYGALQSGLKESSTSWDYRVAYLKDPAYGVKRAWWSCGSGNYTQSICYAVDSGYGFQYVAPDIPAYSYGLCDVADPTVVKFNGSYYLYATGIAQNNSGCSSGKNGNIYGFVSSDARSWTILNSGQPVIAIPDSGDYGLGHPSAVVMQYSYSCNAGNWTASQTTPFIRIYHTSSVDSGDPGYHILAKDSSNGVSFAAHLGPGGVQGILRGSALASGGWMPNVKRVGIFGDYPLVISYSGPWGQYSAVTSGSPSDFSWLGGVGGYVQYYSPTAATSASLEGLGDGTLIDSSGNSFSGYPSGYVNFWWSAGTVHWPTPIYRGAGSALTSFPWSPYMNSCQP